MLISDGSSDVCSSDLNVPEAHRRHSHRTGRRKSREAQSPRACRTRSGDRAKRFRSRPRFGELSDKASTGSASGRRFARSPRESQREIRQLWRPGRSEEHTSELQSLMRNSYAVFCLKKKKIELI